MEKYGAIKKIESEWIVFTKLAESFSEKDRIRPGAIGYWNVHEALLHIADWDNEMMMAVKKFDETGEKPEWDGSSEDAINQLNEQLISERRNLDPALIWKHFKETHISFVEFLSTCDEPVFSGDSFTGGHINFAPQHYQEHSKDLTCFKESL
jgi:hypothetical protein